MRLTLRGWVVLGLLAFVAGMTAQHWNPYTRHADTCVAHIVAYEDGSWDGTDLTLNEEVLDSNWDEHMPTWQWRPQVGQTPCSVALEHLTR